MGGFHSSDKEQLHDAPLHWREVRPLLQRRVHLPVVGEVRFLLFLPPVPGHLVFRVLLRVVDTGVLLPVAGEE